MNDNKKVSRAKVKVLLWSPMGLGNRYNGGGLNARNLLRYLNEDVQVDVFTGVGTGIEQVEGFSRIIVRGALSSKSRLRRLEFLIRSTLWGIGNFRRYDVFHGLSIFETTLFPAMIARLMGVRVFLKLTNSTTGLDGKSLYGLICKTRVIRLKRFSKILAVSEQIENELVELGVSKDRIEYFPNAVDTDKFVCKEIVDYRKRIVFVGALVRRKQPHKVLEVVRDLNKSNIILSVSFVGPAVDDSYFYEMIEFSRKYLNPGQAQFFGYKEELLEFYASSGIFVLPSLNEGMANSLLEAMSCGLIPIVTNVSGTKDIVHDQENGFVVDTISDMVNALKYINCLSDESFQEISRKARLVIQTRFSLRRARTRYLELVNEG